MEAGVDILKTPSNNYTDRQGKSEEREDVLVSTFDSCCGRWPLILLL